MLLDTNVIIDLFRETKPAIIAFDRLLFGQNASVVTKLELIVGEKSQKEAKRTLNILDNLNINFLSLNEEVSSLAETIIYEYHHAKGIEIEDALIAATALVYGEELATKNTKHFDFIPNLKLIKPY